jgi:hypothetical protein
MSILRLSIVPKRKLRHIYYRLDKLAYALNVKSAKGLPLPDFLGLGAMKSATTWLYENLRCHPQLYLPDEKEIYFFSVHFHDEALRMYAERFRAAAGRMAGEITPDYYSNVSPYRIRLIRKTMPQVKLIFLMRNPVNRTWSEACMNLVAKPGKDIREISDKEIIDYFKSPKCLARSDYLTTLNKWLDVFPREQLYIAFFDDVKEKPRLLLTKLFNFLNVSTGVDWDLFPLNDIIVPRYEAGYVVRRGEITTDYQQRNSQIPERFLGILTDMYSDQIEILKRQFGAPEEW